MKRYRLSSIKEKIEEKSHKEEKLEKYNEVIKDIAKKLKHTKIENPNGNKETARGIEKVKEIDLTRNQQDLLDTTTEALERLHIGDMNIFTKEQLIKIINSLITLGMEYNAQIQNDISLIASLDGHCFDFSFNNEQIEALKTYSVWLKEKEQEKVREIGKLNKVI